MKKDGARNRERERDEEKGLNKRRRKEIFWSKRRVPY